MMQNAIPVFIFIDSNIRPMEVIPLRPEFDNLLVLTEGFDLIKRYRFHLHSLVPWKSLLGEGGSTGMLNFVSAGNSCTVLSSFPAVFGDFNTMPANKHISVFVIPLKFRVILSSTPSYLQASKPMYSLPALLLRGCPKIT